MSEDIWRQKQTDDYFYIPNISLEETVRGRVT
jgi:hypothetical protein